MGEKKIVTEKYDGPHQKPSRTLIGQYRKMKSDGPGRIGWHRKEAMFNFWKGATMGRRDKAGLLRCAEDGNHLPIDIKNGKFVYDKRRLTKEEKENLDPNWPDWSYGKKKPFFFPEGA